MGFTRDEIVQLSRDDSAVKASLRDLPVAVGKRLSAGTTAAATGFLASRVGVRVFSTGGLGGVHRGAERSFDESADLGTLAALPLVEVSAGVKSILDIGLTLEYSADSPDEIARVAEARDALGRAQIAVALHHSADNTTGTRA